MSTTTGLKSGLIAYADAQKCETERERGGEIKEEPLPGGTREKAIKRKLHTPPTY